MEAVLERSTIAITCSFVDENEEYITPTAIEWKLVDGDGAVINNRTGVPIAPASSIVIALHGDDCAIVAEGDDGKRQVIVSATYDGDLGSDLEIVGVFEFSIRNIAGKT